MRTTGLEEQRAAAVTVNGAALTFREKMRQAGIDAQTLEVTEVTPGMHERAEGITARPIYRISWRRHPLRLLGMFTLPLTNRGSGRFVKIPPQKVNMPPEAQRRYEMAQNFAEIDESAIFLGTQLADSHLNLILAARIRNQWLELYRWNASWAGLGITRLDICSF